MSWWEKESVEVCTNRCVRIIFKGTGGIHCLGQRLAYFFIGERRVQQDVGKNIQRLVRVFAQTFQRNVNCTAIHLRGERRSHGIQRF